MARFTVLGIGNILMQDDGVGVRLMEAVRDGSPWPADVEFIDGGAGGLNLLTIIEEAQRLIVFDAADMSLPPGEFRIITPEQIAQEDTSGRLSLHETSFVETLELCRQHTKSPQDVTILAIQPAIADYGRGLSPALQTAFPKLLTAGISLVQQKIISTS